MASCSQVQAENILENKNFNSIFSYGNIWQILWYCIS